jgi:hypothetical protein
MLYCKNVPTWERIARVLIGLCVAAAGDWRRRLGDCHRGGQFRGLGFDWFLPHACRVDPQQKAGAVNR